MLPKLRSLQTNPTVHAGQPGVLLVDPLRLSGDQVVFVPQILTPLLGLCDGTRDAATLSTAFQLRTGIPLTMAAVESLLSALDDAFLLENERFAAAKAVLLSKYRSAPFRPPFQAGQTYPADGDQLRSLLQEYCEAATKDDPPADAGLPTVKGLITPHIDYGRGWGVYPGVWQAAAGALDDVDLVVIFGTNHIGGDRILTLTRQRYATPWGVLPMATEMVERLAKVLGEEAAFEEELHHRTEHSVETAVVWLHYHLGDRSCQLLPILCGSFVPFVQDEGDPTQDAGLEEAIAVLRETVASRRTLVVAAGDLAHVGPAFGDPFPLGSDARRQLLAADQRLLTQVCAGDALATFAEVKREGDRWRVCGLAPIYLALRLLEGTKGEVTGYAHCPAGFGSFVSICGVVFR